ncbi:MAG: glycosyltransferase [Proteobacteria bacterium]|nr:glycosyltransferase [Pseudomonadota bacterium]
MDILLVDDSIAFDGYTPSSQPLGGIEKAFASLPAALRRRGHDVRVINRCGFPITAEGVPWQTWKDSRPSACDVLIAHRKPALLDFPVTAKRHILWLAGESGYLEKGLNPAVLERHGDAPLVFSGAAHRATCPRAFADRAVIVEPGVRRDYLDAGDMVPAHPPRAVVTTHPSMDLGWLIGLWTKDVKPKVADAELHIYSAILTKASLGGEVPERIAPIYKKVMAARDDGVVVERPRADPDMAETYRAARVHLYPGADGEVYCSTLAETQAVGLPAVTRRHAAASERIRDSETGFAVPDDEAFASCAMLLLSHDDIFDGRSRDARAHQRGRHGGAAAGELESFLH